MHKVIIPVIAAALLFSCNESKPDDSTEAANDSNNEKFDKNSYEEDAAFAVKAADGGMLEVKAANLAIARTSNPDVKALAEIMKEDHSKANAELAAMASMKNITLPDSVSKDNMDKYNKLAEKTGKEFDKAYVEMMVDDHDKDIQLFDKEAMGGTETDIRNWAAAKLPTLRHHHDMAKETQDKLKNDPAYK